MVGQSRTRPPHHVLSRVTSTLHELPPRQVVQRRAQRPDELTSPQHGAGLDDVAAATFRLSLLPLPAQWISPARSPSITPRSEATSSFPVRTVERSQMPQRSQTQALPSLMHARSPFTGRGGAQFQEIAPQVHRLRGSPVPHQPSLISPARHRNPRQLPQPTLDPQNQKRSRPRVRHAQGQPASNVGAMSVTTTSVSACRRSPCILEPQ